ncbi:hypothetical protein KC887_00570 [Candidatus Kaiserbacteria bacterium]|nr:hypothetical protein [Candidatus Kaiserbacteria bacterium]
MGENEILRQALEDVMRYLTKQLQQRIEKQGHRLTGKAIRTMEFTVDVRNGVGVGEINMEFYTQFLERGVPAARIPFSGRSGRGGVSKYIQALADYFKKRGVPEREQLRAAFATAHKHKREGMPTRASKRFSQDTGSARTGFITRTVQESQDAIITILGNKVEQTILVRIERAFTGAEGVLVF